MLAWQTDNLPSPMKLTTRSKHVTLAAFKSDAVAWEPMCEIVGSSRQAVSLYPVQWLHNPALLKAPITGVS